MIGFFTGLISLVGVGGMVADKLKGINENATKVYKFGSDVHTGMNRSYADMASVLRIEPITMVDQSISHLPEMNNIMQSALSVFSAHFLQSVDVIGCQIDGISVGSVLGQLNPNRVPGMESLTTRVCNEMLMVNYRDKLPTRQVRRISQRKYVQESIGGGFGSGDDDEGVGSEQDNNSHHSRDSERDATNNFRYAEAYNRYEKSKIEKESAEKRAMADDDRNAADKERARQAKAAADEAEARHQYETDRRNRETAREMNERANLPNNFTVKEYEQFLKTRTAENRAKLTEMELVEKEAQAALNRKKLLNSSYKDIQSELEAAAKMPQEEFAIYTARKNVMAADAAKEEQIASIVKFKKDNANAAHTSEYAKELKRKEDSLQDHINYGIAVRNTLAAVEKEYAETIKYRHNKTNISTGDEIRSIHEAVNLSVGRVYKVDLKRNGHEMTVPVTIRLLTNILPSNMLKELFTSREAFDMDWKERYHSWKSGNISFMDFVLMNDLMDKRRKGVIRDQSDVMREINRRSAHNLQAGIATGKPSVANMSNIAIVSQTTMEEIEYTLGGRMSNGKVREAVFNSTNLMLIFVVDPHAEMIKLYTRNIALPSTLSFKDVTTTAKKGGADVNDLLKAYMVGRSPQF